jgi:hypothetical protein
VKRTEQDFHHLRREKQKLLDTRISSLGIYLSERMLCSLTTNFHDTIARFPTIIIFFGLKQLD